MALLLACTHGRLRPAQLDGAALEAAFADHVIELADGVIRFTHRCSPPCSIKPRRRRLGGLRTNAWPRSSTTRSLARAIARLQRMSRTRRSPRSSRRRPAVAIARGAPIVAAELWEHALRVDTAPRTRGRHRRALAAARAHLAAGEGARPRAIALELLATRPQVQRAPRRSSFCPSSRECSARSRSSKRRSLEGNAALQVSLHRRLALLGRLTKVWSGHSVTRVRRSTLPMAWTTTRSEPALCPRSRSFASTAAMQTRLERGACLRARGRLR